MDLQNLENIKEQKLFRYKDLYPKLHESVYLASGVKLIGDVQIGKNSSVWYNCVVRGDVHYVKIGNDTNIQDLSMLHVTNNRFPLTIGNKVTIGHSVKLHGCTIQDLTLIGIGAIVLDGAIVEEKSLVAAGTVIKPGFVVPSGKMVAGVPGKIIRDLSQAELDDFEASSERYKKYTKLTVESLTKNEEF